MRPGLQVYWEPRGKKGIHRSPHSDFPVCLNSWYVGKALSEALIKEMPLDSDVLLKRFVRPISERLVESVHEKRWQFDFFVVRAKDLSVANRIQPFLVAVAG